MGRALLLALAATAAAVGAGCASEPERAGARADAEQGSAVIAPEPRDADAALRRATWPILPPPSELGRDRAGSEVVIGRIKGRRFVFVADADARRVAAVDADARRELARPGGVDVGGEPSAMVIGADGRLYVAVRDKNVIAVVEATGAPDASLRVVASFPTAAEPVGLALSADGGALVVASAFGRRLEVHATRSRSTSRRSRVALSVALPREPRAVALSSDGQTAFVSHMVGGAVSAVDLSAVNSLRTGANSDGAGPGLRAAVSTITLRGADFTPPPMAGCGLAAAPDPLPTARAAVQGFALVRLDGRLLAPQALARPGDPRTRSDGYGHAVSDLPSQVGVVAVIDEASRRPSYDSLNLPALDVAAYLRRHKDCLLPRAAAADEAAGTLVIACADTAAALEVDPTAPDPARAVLRRFPAALGSSGIAIDGAEREAFVWSKLVRSLDVLTLAEPKRSSSPRRERDQRGKRAAKIALEPLDSEDGAVSMGRLLFHSSGDPRIAADGRACASCHPDGRDDGLVWPTPEGPRQPPMLAGRLRGAEPYSWTDGHATIKDHLRITLSRLRGKGLDEPSLDALSAYVLSLPGPSPEAPLTTRGDVTNISGDLDNDALALRTAQSRGRALFHSDDVGCAACHREETAFTDRSLHDVSSAAQADRFSVFDTPSLRFVGGTAPYFHDGRFATLGALLAGTRTTMGMTRGLSDADLSALEAYLESL